MDVWDNIIGATGAQHLANLLKNHSTQQVFHIWIYTVALNYMFLFIQGLTVLNIGWNEIGAEGVRYLANALQYNTVILAISISIYSNILHFPT